jgi:hypothetical protein
LPCWNLGTARETSSNTQALPIQISLFPARTIQDCSKLHTDRVRLFNLFFFSVCYVKHFAM